jgi:hypothetical protein
MLPFLMKKIIVYILWMVHTSVIALDRKEWIGKNIIIVTYEQIWKNKWEPDYKKKIREIIAGEKARSIFKKILGRNQTFTCIG